MQQAGAPRRATSATAPAPAWRAGSRAAWRPPAQGPAPAPPSRSRSASGRPSVQPCLADRFPRRLEQEAHLTGVFIAWVKLEGDPQRLALRVGPSSQGLNRSRARRDRRLQLGDRGAAERLAGEVDEEAPAAPGRAAPDPRRRDGRDIRPIGRMPAPELAIAEDDLGACRHRGLRSPIGQDVVVDLGFARDLDQLDGALAPLADRLDPQARAALPALLVVLEGGVVALALDEAEALRILVEEDRDLQRLGVLERAPDPLVGAVVHLHAARFVDRRAGVVDAAAVDRTEEIARAHAAEADMLESDAREKRGLDVDDRHLAGAEGHAHGAARRFRIDQRVHHERIRAGARTLDPEGPEERELLAAGLRRPQGQGPRDEAEALAAGERPEEARALHERELDRLAARAGQGGGEQAKPGIGDVAEIRRHVELAELEAAPFIGDPAHALVLDGEQQHRAREYPPAMQRLDHEAAALAGPDLGLRQRADADILLVIQVRERFRQVGGHRGVGALGERAGELDNGGRLEALAFAERRPELRQGRPLRQGGRRRGRPDRGAAHPPPPLRGGPQRLHPPPARGRAPARAPRSRRCPSAAAGRGGWEAARSAAAKGRGPPVGFYSWHTRRFDEVHPPDWTGRDGSRAAKPI